MSPAIFVLVSPKIQKKKAFTVTVASAINKTRTYDRTQTHESAFYSVRPNIAAARRRFVAATMVWGRHAAEMRVHRRTPTQIHRKQL